MNAPSAGAAEPSLRRALALRLLGVGLIVLLTVGGVLVVLRAVQEARAARQWIDETAAHFDARTRQTDADWLREAALLRTQIEFTGVLDGSDERVALARLTSLLTAIGGQGAFTHVVLAEAGGRVLLRHSSRSAGPLDDAGSTSPGWTFGAEDRLLYRSFRLPLRLGTRGRGELILFAPLDNALLRANAFPETTISLHWQDRADLATSYGGPGAHPAPDGRARLGHFVAWAGEPGGPQLHVERLQPELLPPAELFGVAAAGVGLGALFAWLVVGRWAGSLVGALAGLSQAIRAFVGGGRDAPAAGRRIDAAVAGAHVELRRLGSDLRALMNDVEAAQSHLRELNATLEQRIAHRTVELAAARDEALAAARAKSQFLAAMSHELRTPLVGLLGSLELLAAEALPAAARRRLEVARRSGEALRDVIDDVLDYSKLEASGAALQRRPLRADEVADEALSLHAAVAQRKGVALHRQVDAAAAVPLLGDPVRLRQVLLNLVGNAVKFTERGEVALRLHAAPAGEGALRLRFEVEDSGVGIDEALQAQLFTPFVQADATRAEARGGTGLGLAISQRLVAAMGGRIEVDSRVGQGSRFFFEIVLPRDGAAATAAPAAAAPRPALAGRVLLVEDNAVNRVVASAMLERLGLQVEECEDGLQALQRLRDRRYDAVLMDNQMPVLDGLQATQRIRAGAAGASAARVPIIAVTANALEGDAERCLAAGMDAHVAKPFTESELAHALARWLAPRPAGA